MTQLVITPKVSDKTARFNGTVAAGEHVAVTIKGGAEWLGAPESVLFGLPILAALILLAMAGRKRLPAEQGEDV